MPCQFGLAGFHEHRARPTEAAWEHAAKAGQDLESSDSSGRLLRSPCRYSDPPESRDWDLGFRVVLPSHTDRARRRQPSTRIFSADAAQR